MCKRIQPIATSGRLASVHEEHPVYLWFLTAYARLLYMTHFSWVRTSPRRCCLGCLCGSSRSSPDDDEDDDGDDEDAWSMDMAREHAHYGAKWVNACVCGGLFWLGSSMTDLNLASLWGVLFRSCSTYGDPWLRMTARVAQPRLEEGHWALPWAGAPAFWRSSPPWPAGMAERWRHGWSGRPQPRVQRWDGSAGEVWMERRGRGGEGWWWVWSTRMHQSHRGIMNTAESMRQPASRATMHAWARASRHISVTTMCDWSSLTTGALNSLTSTVVLQCRDATCTLAHTSPFPSQAMECACTFPTRCMQGGRTWSCFLRVRHGLLSSPTGWWRTGESDMAMTTKCGWKKEGGLGTCNEHSQRLSFETLLKTCSLSIYLSVLTTTPPPDPLQDY